MAFLFGVCERFDVVDESFRSATRLYTFFPLFDYSYTTLTLVLLVNLFFLTFFLWYIIRRSGFIFKTTTAGLIFDFLVSVSFGILKKQTGSKGYPYFSFILSLFFFILFANMLGLLPWAFSASAQPVFTCFLSLSVWLLGVYVGFELNGVNFYKVIVPSGVPVFMLPFLVLVEFLSYCIRVFSLAIRLSANVTAGHILLFTIAGFVINLFNISIFFSFITWIILAGLYILELGLMALQVYVFVTLTAIYLNDSINFAH